MTRNPHTPVSKKKLKNIRSKNLRAEDYKKKITKPKATIQAKEELSENVSKYNCPFYKNNIAYKGKDKD